MSLIGRLKPQVAALLVTAGLWTAPAFAAGTIPLAMAQQIDINGQPLANCQVNFFVAGTVSSPQNAFADFGLTQSLGSQLSCDQAGRVPMFWLADGLIHVRMIDAAGSPQVDVTMQVLGPSSGGGGGGGTVDPTALISTGDLKPRYGTGPLAGYVRTNGLTIGNVTSGATERANADTQPLFIYLYNTDANLVVSGGRSGNALNDYNASKTIVVPDWSGYALQALDDQGAGPQGRLTATYFGTNPTVLGAAGGSQSHTLSLSEVPAGITTTSGSITINVANAAQAINVANAAQTINVANASQAINVANASQTINASGVNSISASGPNSISVTSASNRLVHNTGLVNSATAGGGVEGIFADVNAVTMAAEVSSNGSQNISVANAAQNINVSGVNNITASGANAISATGVNNITATGVNNITASGANTINTTSNNTGGAAHSIVMPAKLATIYMKL